MIVEVLVAEVGEARCREPHGIDATEVERARRDLHRHGADAVVAHLREEILELVGLRHVRSAPLLDVARDSVDEHAVVADETGVLAGRPGDRLEERGGRALSRGSGDAEAAHGAGRVSVQPRRGRTEDSGNARDHGLGDARDQGDRTFHQKGHRPVDDGLRRVVVAVEPRARPAREAGTGAYSATVLGDEGDLDVGVVHALHDVEAGEQLVPPHTCASSRLFDHPAPVRVPVGLHDAGSRSHGAGGTRSAPNACCMIWANAGAATVPPKMALLGSSSTTIAARRGAFAGANPTNDATYL